MSREVHVALGAQAALTQHALVQGLERAVREQAQAFGERRRQHFLAGRVLLDRLHRHAYDRAAPPVLAKEEAKPAFAGMNPPAFNLSHSGHAAAAVLADGGMLGIDLEQRRAGRDWRGVANHYYTPAEQAWLDRQSDPEAAFYMLWVLREAVLKACGSGLAGQSALQPEPEAQRLLQPWFAEGAVYVGRWADCALAVCVPGAAEHSLCWWECGRDSKLAGISLPALKTWRLALG